MRKFVVAVTVAVGLMVIPGMASAAPVQPAACADLGFFSCDLYADYEDGLSELGDPLNPGGYLSGYLLLLNADAELGDDLTSDEVAHILVVEDSLMRLYSNVATLLFNFNTIFLNTIADAASAEQILGCPVPDGVSQVNGVGYCTTADLVTIFPTTIFGNDILNIHTALVAGPNDPDPNAPVPEPGTMSLLALGGAAAAAVRRRRAAKELKASTSAN